MRFKLIILLLLMIVNNQLVCNFDQFFEINVISPYYMDLYVDGDMVYTCGLLGVVNISQDRGKTWKVSKT